MFGAEVDRIILDAAMADDHEICGYVLDGKVFFVENQSESPAETFSTQEVPDDAQAIFHSHPGGPFYPSKLDMQQQMATDIPWAIACTHPQRNEVFWFGDPVPSPPLLGRGFRHGVTDCYELIRDYYWQIHNIRLKQKPRSWEWWHDGERMYEDNFVDVGFFEVPMSEIAPSDVFLATINSETPNHAGVYIGDGLILHHVSSRSGYDPTRLSVIEPAARWMKFLTKVIRNENDQIDRKTPKGVWFTN